MSHVTTIDLEIKDLIDLTNGCQRLGCTVEAQKTFTGYYGQNPCDYIIQVPGAKYQVGVIREGNKYRLSWDDWSSGGLKKVLGENMGKLKQAYAVEATKRAARREGYQVTEKRTILDRFRGALGMKQVDGIRLTLRRG